MASIERGPFAKEKSNSDLDVGRVTFTAAPGCITTLWVWAGKHRLGWVPTDRARF